MKQLKKICSSALFISLLSCFLWELFLKIFFVNAFNFLLSAKSSLIRLISNSIYQSIGEGDINSLYIVVFLLLFSFSSANILDFSLKWFKSNFSSKPDQIEEEKEGTRSLQTSRKYIFSLISFLVYVISFFGVTISAYTYSEKIRLTNDIEIISPYISDYDYKLLRSNYYSIRTKEDYDAFNQTLNLLSEEHNIHLK